MLQIKSFLKAAGFVVYSSCNILSSRCLEEFLPYWNYEHLESMNSNDYTTDRQVAGMCADLTFWN